jgi:hypothetical protein
MTPTPPLRRLAPLALGLAYLLLRLPGLLALPLFNDEAVYLLRAQHFPHMLLQNPIDSGTLPDGKLIQELLLAALAGLPGDPLLWARLLSLACGLGTLAALARCGRLLGRPGAGLLAGLLYALAPMAQIHDRLAIPDSMLTLASAALLAASLAYARAERAGRRAALGLGLLLALACLVKLSGLFLALVPPLAVIFLTPPGARRQRLAMLRMALIVALVAIAALAPFHYGGAERQKAGGPGDRLGLIGQNVLLAAGWLLRYLPGPLLVLPLGALCRRRPPASQADQLGPQRVIGLLLAVGLALAAIFVLVGSALYPRYMFMGWPALLLAAAVGSGELWRDRLQTRALAGLGLGAAMIWGGFFALRYSADPRSAPLAAADRRQYTQSWTAGYGLGELLQTLRGAAAGGPIALASNDQPRLATLAGRIYLAREPQIAIVTVELSADSAAAQLHALAAAGPTYLLADQQLIDAYRLRERLPALRAVQVVRNPDSPMRFYLFAVDP